MLGGWVRGRWTADAWMDRLLTGQLERLISCDIMWAKAAAVAWNSTPQDRRFVPACALTGTGPWLAMWHSWASAGPIPMVSPESFQALALQSWPALTTSWKLSTYKTSATLSKWPFQELSSLGGTKEMVWPATTYRGQHRRTTYPKSQVHQKARETGGSSAFWKDPGTRDTGSSSSHVPTFTSWWPQVNPGTSLALTDPFGKIIKKHSHIAILFTNCVYPDDSVWTS